MYTIAQAAKILKVSRQTVYNKLDKLSLQHIQDTDRGKLLTDEGFETLKSMLSYQDFTVNSQPKDVKIDKYIDTLLDSIKAENDNLKSIINDQSKQIANLTRLLENSQILLKHEQEKNQLLLESSESKKISFWSRFRK